MADWMREMSLQRTYGLGPAEARYVAGVMEGMSIEEMAASSGVSFYTVRTMVQRGKMKISGKRGASKEAERDAGEGWDTLVVLIKGQVGDERMGVKLPGALAVMSLAGRILGVPVRNGQHVMMMPMPRQEGDASWFKDNVFKYTYLADATMQDYGRKVERMYELYEKAGGTPDRMGLAVIRYMFDQMYLRYEVWDPMTEAGA